MENNQRDRIKEYNRHYNRQRREAEEPFRSFPTPPEIQQQVEEEYPRGVRPVGFNHNTYRSQKARRKLQLKKEHCERLANMQGKQNIHGMVSRASKSIPFNSDRTRYKTYVEFYRRSRVEHVYLVNRAPAFSLIAPTVSCCFYFIMLQINRQHTPDPLTVDPIRPLRHLPKPLSRSIGLFESTKHMTAPIAPLNVPCKALHKVPNETFNNCFPLKKIKRGKNDSPLL